MKPSMFESCAFPELPAKYDRALREAVLFILDQFNPIGIVATGTIVRGNPDPASDLDVWVIHLAPMRQRIQKFFDRVPAEIFVNPPWVIENYFQQDQLAARPITAHMLATGFVVMDIDPQVEKLRKRAQALIAQAPSATPDQLESARYAAATMFEDATDIAERDLLASSMLLSRAVVKMLHFAFMKARRFIPRDKDLLRNFESAFPGLAPTARRFFETADVVERFRLAGVLADHIVGARGFFEWSSLPEDKPEPAPEPPDGR